MKIIEIIPTLQSGGAEKFVVDFVNETSKSYKECILVTLFDLGIEDILSSHVNKNVTHFSLGKHTGFDIKCLFRLYRYVKKEKPDVVHAHVGAITYLIIVAILYRKCKYFATIHSEAKREAGSGVNKFVRKLLFKTKLVYPITISNESEKSFRDFYGMSGNIIFNGCSSYSKIENVIKNDFRKGVDFLFIHVGRLQPVKNQIALVKAFNLLLDSGAKARLLILGRAEYKQILDNLSPYLSENIIYLGEQSDTRAYMSVCDAFCLSSTMEGMPITIIEAFSVGCVPIVTPVGGCINMIDNNVNGILSSDTTDESIYKALKYYVGLNSEKRKEMSDKAKETFNKEYSIERTVREYFNLFLLKS